MQNLTEPHPSTRPPLAFRVGITGARALNPTQIPRLRTEIAALLKLVADDMTANAALPRTRAAFAGGSPRLQLLSPLAEGADRLAAEVARSEGISLTVAMPFPREEYETDFPDTTAAFRDLIEQADRVEGAAAVLALDGTHGPEAEASYRAVGRLVVRNSDLVLAVWDGKPGKPGGTGEIVQFATRNHVPVWWIHATDAVPPRLLFGRNVYRHRTASPAGDAAIAALIRLLDATFLPPEPEEPYRPFTLGRLVNIFCAVSKRISDPLQEYANERLEPVRPLLWRTYAAFVDRVASMRGAPSSVASPPPSGAAEIWWDRLYTRTDALSNAYGDRYRSSYVLILGSAALTVSATALGSSFPERLGSLAAIVEFLGVCGILVLVIANHLHRWHERWIAYRLLAELCRKQRFLAPLARSLPVSLVAELGREEFSGFMGRLDFRRIRARCPVADRQYR